MSSGLGLPLPDLAAGVVARIQQLRGVTLPANTTITDQFGQDWAAHLPYVVAAPIPGGLTVDSRWLFVVPFQVNTLADNRADSFAYADAVRVEMTRKGGFRLDVNGVTTRGICTLIPHRVPNDQVAEHLATYDLTVRISQAA